MQKYFAGSIGVMNAGNYRPLARIEMSSNPADHEVYLASEVDARIAELEAALREVDDYMDDAPTVRAIIRKALGL